MKPAAGLAGIGWSASYSVVTRASTLVAVPLVLGGVGVDLYAVWVLAGVLIMSQGLVDLGMGAALVRFVSVSAAGSSGPAITVVLRRAGFFYLSLSVIVGLPLWVFADTLVGLFDYIGPDDAADATALTRYAAVSFALTNGTVVFASTLQGMNRVDSAFRGQTIGWLLFIPALAAGFALGLGVHAIGIAWLLSFLAQASLTAAATVRSVRGYATNGSEAPPSIRTMLSLGGRWQISAWADFGTFQLPRLLGGVLLGAESLLALDLALRFAQVVVMPVFIALPLVLPRATTAWARGGPADLAQLLERFAYPGFASVVIGAAAAAPLAAPAISVWTNRSLESVDPLLAGIVVVGVAAHASTGLLSSALLASGEVGAVVVYKYRQLALGIMLVGVGALIDALATGAAIAIALLVPALSFNSTAARRLGLSPLSARRTRSLITAGTAVCGSTAAVVALCRSSGIGSTVTLGVSAAFAVAVMSGAIRWLDVSWASLLSRRPPPTATESAGETDPMAATPPH